MCARTTLERLHARHRLLLPDLTATMPTGAAHVHPPFQSPYPLNAVAKLKRTPIPPMPYFSPSHDLALLHACSRSACYWRRWWAVSPRRQPWVVALDAAIITVRSYRGHLTTSTFLHRGHLFADGCLRPWTVPVATTPSVALGPCSSLAPKVTLSTLCPRCPPPFPFGNPLSGTSSTTGRLRPCCCRHEIRLDSTMLPHLRAGVLHHRSGLPLVLLLRPRALPWEELSGEPLLPNVPRTSPPPRCVALVTTPTLLTVGFGRRHHCAPGSPCFGSGLLAMVAGSVCLGLARFGPSAQWHLSIPFWINLNQFKLVENF
jgi:hypothetical protein